MKKLVVILTVLVSTVSTAAAQQRQGAWWYTSEVGLNFNVPNPPAVILIPNIVAGAEGSATLSDAYGNVLLSGGSPSWLYNRQFAPLPAHQGGNADCTLLLPDPASPHLCHAIACSHAFTTGPWRGTLEHSVIDMRLDSGRGDILPPLTPPGLFNYEIERSVGNKLTPVMHANGRDVWIIYPNGEGDSLSSRLLSGAGLGPPTRRPAGSPVRLTPPRNRNTFVQRLRSSPSGEQLVCPTDSTLELFTVDRTTGAATHRLSLPMGAGDAAPYYMMIGGAAFSPDNSKLYVARMPYNGRSYTPDQPALMQFDLTPGTAAGILATRTDLLTLAGQDGLLDVQLAMDGKLYLFVAHYGQNSELGRIRCPNQLGAGCQVEPRYRPLPGQLAYAPALNQTLFRNAGRLQAQAARPLSCPGDTVRLLAFGAGAETFVWTTATGQSLSGAQPLVAPLVPTRYFVTGTGACGTTDTASVVVRLSAPLAPFDLGPDAVLPAGQTLTLAVNNPGQRVRWSTGDTTQTLLVTAPGTYWARVFNAGGCALSDTVRVLRPLGLLTAAEAGAEALRVWPNPATAGVQVAVAAGGPVMLLDALGRVVRRAVAVANQPVAWALADLPAGVYVVRAGAATRRLVVE